jgi:hypothetical protein
MKATQEQYQEAVTIYEKHGQSGVYAYADKIGVGIDEWSYCAPCETLTPDCHDDSCLVCGSSKSSGVTREEYAVLKTLRLKGYAVVIFDPEELQGVEPRYVEDALVTEAWVIIDALKD